MKKLGAAKAGGFGLAAGIATIALTYLGHRLAGLPYLPFDIFDWLARVLPGRLVATSIDTMVMIIRGLRLGPTASTAKLAEQGMALAQFAATWVVFGLVLGVAGPAPAGAPDALRSARRAAPLRFRGRRRMGPGIPEVEPAGRRYPGWRSSLSAAGPCSAGRSPRSRRRPTPRPKIRSRGGGSFDWSGRAPSWSW